MSWRCLLDGDARVKSHEAIHDILSAISRRMDDRGGFDGAGGLACLHAYAGLAWCDESLTDRGGAYLDAALEGLKHDRGTAGLWGGLADLRFLVAHLAGDDSAESVLHVMGDALLGDLDARAVRQIDLIGGLAGIGVAALEGGANGLAVAARVLAILEETAEADDLGMTWFTPPERLPAWQRAICAEGYWNLGLAHGIPGVIGFLAAALTAGVDAERARRLLEGAVPWLLIAAPPRRPGRFPSWRGPGAPTEPARLAWCYGDPGVAVALLAAARAAGNAAWESEGVAMARAMSTRSFQDSGVLDAGICHGAAGVAHIFNRLYQATGDRVLADASRAWCGRLLDMRRPGAEIAGFPARNVDDGFEVWQPDPGVLMGAAGVALVLLAASTDVEPEWDRALLCGLPVQGAP